MKARSKEDQALKARQETSSSMHPRPPAPKYDPPQSPFLDVIYEDDAIVGVAKPAGLLSVPGRTPDLADCIAARADIQAPGARIVHRLDLDTSGVMVLARTADAHRHLGRQFEERSVSKTYIAHVVGHVDDDNGTISAPLSADWPNRPRQQIDHDNGKPAVTHWRVLSRDNATTRLELTPTTGRTHQLRVHLQSIGHPIVGDRLYGVDSNGADRLHLHAATLTLVHPTTSNMLTLAAQCPF